MIVVVTLPLAMPRFLLGDPAGALMVWVVCAALAAAVVLSAMWVFVDVRRRAAPEARFNAEAEQRRRAAEQHEDVTSFEREQRRSANREEWGRQRRCVQAPPSVIAEENRTKDMPPG